MKKLLAAVFIAAFTFSFSYADKSSGQDQSFFIEKLGFGEKYVSQIKTLIDEYVKNIKEMTSNMTAQEKQQFNEMLKESVAETFQKMQSLIDLLSDEDKVKVNKIIGEFVKKLEAK
jgi:hypothetical protein